MDASTRRTLLIALVAIFFAQTWFVYSDPAGSATRLSPLALEGRALWHRHNCQSCHQIYGFGGFLGPDLTNAASRLGGEDPARFEERLATILTGGSARMPAFGLQPTERHALAAFLTELDASGVGQLHATSARPPRQLFAELVQAALRGQAELTQQEQLGWDLMSRHGCIDCHLPNPTSSFRSTDLTTLFSTLGAPRIREVLSHGLAEKGMPNFGLEPEEIAALQAFLKRLSTVGGPLRQSYAASARAAGGSLFNLPWFEYPR